MLNSQQSKAISIIDKPLIVIAGPGTGKTTLITHKIQSLLNKHNSEEILALTFTQKAAQEMSDRVEQLTNKPFEAKTFHSFALELIEKYSKFISSIDLNYTLLDETNQQIFFLENLYKLKLSSVEIKNNTYQIASALQSSISKLKDFNITLKDLEKLNFEDIQTKIDILTAYSTYEKFKQENNFLDFGDLLILINNLLKTNPKIKQELQTQYKYILVDEFQDTNSVQLEIIQHLAKNNITIVGDQKQSIYSFRGTNYKNLENFKKHFKNFEEIYLTENYRSAKNIIENINKLSPQKEQLTSNSEEKGIIEKIITSDENSQNTFIIEKIREILDKNNKETIGILCRSKSQVSHMSNYLTQINIDHTTTSSNFFNKHIIKEILFLLEVICNPKEANSQIFYLISNIGLRDETVKKISRKSSYNKKSIYLSIHEKDLTEYEGEKEIIKNFLDSLNYLIDKKPLISLQSLFIQTAEKFNLYKKSTINYDIESITALNNFNQFLQKYTQTYKSSNLQHFLKICSLSKNLEIVTENETIKQIEVTTIHQSKGKEYDHVFISSLNDRKFPSQFKSPLFKLPINMTKEEYLQEESRLFFVAISRAKTSNYLITVKRFSDNKLDSKPSKFLDLLNLDIIWYDKTFDTLPLSSKDEIKLEIIKKIQSLLLNENYDEAKKEIDLLKSLFSKKDLSSFININHPQLEDYKKKLENKNHISLNLNPQEYVYSVSQLQTYDTCPKKYLYSYIYKIPSTSKHYFDFGTSLHGVLENIVPEIESKTKDKEMIYAKAISLLHKNWISKGYENSAQEKEYFEKGITAIKNFIEQEFKLKEKNRKTIAREQEFRIEINNKKIMGFIDRVDKLKDKIEILDYKTSNSMETKNKLKDNLQLGVYSLAAKEIYGKYPSRIGLWYLVHNNISDISFEELNLDKIKLKMFDIINSIEKNDFNAKHSFFACKFCDYNNICINSKNS